VQISRLKLLPYAEKNQMAEGLSWDAPGETGWVQERKVWVDEAAIVKGPDHSSRKGKRWQNSPAISWKYGIDWQTSRASDIVKSAIRQRQRVPNCWNRANEKLERQWVWVTLIKIQPTYSIAISPDKLSKGFKDTRWRTATLRAWQLFPTIDR